MESDVIRSEAVTAAEFRNDVLKMIDAKMFAASQIASGPGIPRVRRVAAAQWDAYDVIYDLVRQCMLPSDSAKPVQPSEPAPIPAASSTP